MKVYTYYEPVPGLEDPDMMALWGASWRRHGWETVVLTEADAFAADPYTAERFKHSPLLQSHPLNPPGYVMACLMRYVPMSVTAEPSLHVDWDVICNGYRPESVPAHDFPAVFLAGCRCPCAMFGSPAAWLMLMAIMEGAPKMASFDPEMLRKDNADQYVTMYQMPPDWVVVDPAKPCKTYMEDADWAGAPMIHFPNRLTGYPRSATITKLGFKK